MTSEEPFRILSLDGGGTRGIYAAQILAKVEQSFDIRIRDCFNLIAGTSTGSIIAGAVATGISMAEIVRLFESEAPHIFQKRCFRQGWFRSKYPKKPLEKVLENHLPATKLGEISVPLMIMSSDITTGGVYVFKSNYMKELGKPYYRDKDVQLRDAVLASCAAPTFFDPAMIGSYLLSDGGLWANNPSIISFTEAISKFKKEIDQLRILSLGTGYSENMYAQRQNWGFFTGWGRQKFISYIMALQSQASTNMAKLLLKEKYLRMDLPITHWELDEIAYIGNLKALADANFAADADKIKKFIRIGERNQ